MAGAQGALAIAVSSAGGLGSLPSALLSPDAMRSELAAIKAQTDKPFNVNCFCHATPEESTARDDAWRAALFPFYEELVVDPHDVPSGPGRGPFSADVADDLVQSP